MMKRTFLSFTVGVVVGAVIGILIDDKGKKRIQDTLNKQANRLRKEYERPILEGVEKVKNFVKERLH